MVQTTVQADEPSIVPSTDGSQDGSQFEAQFDIPHVKATKKVRKPKTNGEPVLDLATLEEKLAISFDVQLPDPEDTEISAYDFQKQIELAWQVCDRLDLQTDVWRGKILRAVRDRERISESGNGLGFLNWLKDREISRSTAYNLIDLAECADRMIDEGYLEAEDVNKFTKRAFMETAKSSTEVQQVIADSAKQGKRITRREVKQLSDEWVAMTSDLIPEELRVKAADQTIPPRYIAPLVKQMERLPVVHQDTIREAVAENPDLGTLKQVTAEARYLARYLEGANQVQALNNSNVDLELALEEALRLGVLNTTAELVNQSGILEGTIAKLYGSWRKMNQLSERLYVDTGASTPHLRGLLGRLDQLCGETVEITIGDPNGEGFSRTIRLTIEESGEMNSSQLDATEISISENTNVSANINVSEDTIVDPEDDDLGEW
jgi:hypothetical protein